MAPQAVNWMPLVLCVKLTVITGLFQNGADAPNILFTIFYQDGICVYRIRPHLINAAPDILEIPFFFYLVHKALLDEGDWLKELSFRIVGEVRCLDISLEIRTKSINCALVFFVVQRVDKCFDLSKRTVVALDPRYKTRTEIVIESDCEVSLRLAVRERFGKILINIKAPALRAKFIGILANQPFLLLLELIYEL